MLAHTKKPLTERITICLTGPVGKKEELLNKIADTGFSVHEEIASVPWREALNASEQDLPGVFLTGARFREGMTQEQLAAATGIPRRHISEMENNRRPIGKKTPPSWPKRSMSIRGSSCRRDGELRGTFGG